MGTQVILQARTSSKRLPKKVIKLLNGKPMIERQIDRIRNSKRVDAICIATSDSESDDIISEIGLMIGVDVFRGSLENVLSRFQLISKDSTHENIVRLTADCPFVSPELLDAMIDNYENSDYDYYSNTLNRTFPRGLDVEIFCAKALNKLSEFELTQSEIEHVTMGIYSRPDLFKLGNFSQPENLSFHRWTVDTESDFEFVAWVYSKFQGCETEFDQLEILQLLKQHPEKINYEVPA